jgi:hypothetical protein
MLRPLHFLGILPSRSSFQAREVKQVYRDYLVLLVGGFEAILCSKCERSRHSAKKPKSTRMTHDDIAKSFLPEQHLPALARVIAISLERTARMT